MTRAPVDVTGAPDPVAAWHEADRTGRVVALSTSGTTDAPRRVVRTTESWSVHFDTVASLMQLRADARVWVPGPLTGTMNLYAAVHADAVGAAWSPHPGQATHAVLTPAVLSRALAQGIDLLGVRVVVAGDRLPEALRSRAAAAGVALDHYYGAAELSFVGWGPGPQGLAPFPGVEVECRDDRLWVRSPGVALGYARPPGASGLAGPARPPGPAAPPGLPGPLRVDAEGWATVGDRGSVIATPEGPRIMVTGRDDAVVTAGATVLLADIEEALSPVAQGEVVAVPVPHTDLGAVIGVVLTVDADLESVLAQATLSLPRVAWPRLVGLVDALPLTTGGKVDRAGLGREVAAVRAGGVSAHGIRIRSAHCAGEDGPHE